MESEQDIPKFHHIRANCRETLSFWDLPVLQLSAGDPVGLAIGVPAVALTVNGTTYETQNGTSGDDLLEGGPGHDWLSGLDGNDTLTGGDESDILDGGTGADTMIGGAGDDEYVVDSLADSVLENATEDHDTIRTDLASFSLSGIANVEGLTGGAGDQQLTGNAENNWIDGGLGADIMAGGLGDDIYWVDSVSDHVVENAGEGFDRIMTTLSTYALDPVTNIEGLIGDAGDQTLIGNSSDNTLIGYLGADTLIGGQGDDVYRIIDSAAHQVLEGIGEGRDWVLCAVDYVLASGAEVEALTTINFRSDYLVNITGNEFRQKLTGNGGANSLNGAGGDDIVWGLEGDDVLDGGTGADRMLGGAGNDIFIVDNAGDYVSDYHTDDMNSAGSGTDEVRTSVSFSLSDADRADIENLTAVSSDGLTLTGNSLANVITGGAGSDVLNGGAGADTLRGDDGNDIYYFDNTGDRASDNADGGYDTVYSSVGVALGANIECLFLTGAESINGKGNELGNALYGNDGDNVIDGRAGADAMRGGAGNDTYLVDNAGDRAFESSTSGIDTVKATVSFTLGANVERLVLTGEDAINGKGNASDNRLSGNDSSNMLVGLEGADNITAGAGADRLYGGSGNDLLTGGDGADRFYFDTELDSAANFDRILDFNAAEDTVLLDQDVFSAFATTGTLSASAFHVGTVAHDEDDRIVYDSTSGCLYYDADGDGAGEQVLFGQVTAGLTLASADFSIMG